MYIVSIVKISTQMDTSGMYKQGMVFLTHLANCDKYQPTTISRNYFVNSVGQFYQLLWRQNKLGVSKWHCSSIGDTIEFSNLAPQDPGHVSRQNFLHTIPYGTFHAWLHTLYILVIIQVCTLLSRQIHPVIVIRTMSQFVGMLRDRVENFVPIFTTYFKITQGNDTKTDKTYLILNTIFLNEH